MEFELHEQLRADTLKVGSLDMCELLLMNDSRWLWLILVPRLEGAAEWHDLFADQRQDLDFEIANVASALKAITGCEKINIGSLGNMVRQLHIHIIARGEGDPNWPGPVWGFGNRIAYQDAVASDILETIQATLDITHS